MEDEEIEQLLFFDTFAHGASEGINLDLVQFQKPVVITEIRVIPLGARVQADFPGGVRLGATNPSAFKIEFFINDLKTHCASAFESLGLLDYRQTQCIHFECKERIPTDGLVLRGWYTTITLAVYGYVSKPLPPPPAPDPRSREISAQAATAEWVQNQQAIYTDPSYAYPPDYPPVEPTYSVEWHETTPAAAILPGDPYQTEWARTDGASPRLDAPAKRDSWEKADDGKRYRKDGKDDERRRNSPERWRDERTRSGREKSSDSPYSENRRRPRSPKRPTTPPHRSPDRRVRSPRPPSPKTKPVHLHIEAGDSPQTPLLSPQFRSDERNFEQEEFEPILSDDDIPDDVDGQYGDLDYDTVDDLEEVVKHFSPFQFKMGHLQKIADPSLTEFENNLQTGGNPESFTSLKAHLDGLKIESSEEFLTSVEQILPLLPQALAHACPEDLKAKLLNVVKFALNFEAALEQISPGSKIRHLKAGPRLVAILSHCGFVADLVQQGVQEDLLRLYHKQYMALSIRLLILKSFDATLLDAAGINRMVSHKWLPDWDQDSQEGCSYDFLFRMIEVKEQVRAKLALTSLLEKVHFNELLENFIRHGGINMPTDDILTYLAAIRRIFNEAPEILSQPTRFLPVTKQFEVAINSKPAYLFIYRCLRRFNFLETILHLLNSKNIPIQNAACQLLHDITQHLNGLLFIAHSNHCNSLIVRLQNLDDNLGTVLPNSLMTISCLDRLILGKSEEDVFNGLHDLFSVTYHPMGKFDVARVLAMEDNFGILMKLFGLFGERSAVRGYVVDLCDIMLRYSEDVAWAALYANEVAKFSEIENSDTKIQLVNWVKPFLDPSNSIQSLCEILKKHATDFTGVFDGEIITTIRYIRSSCTPANNQHYGEMSSKFSLLQFYTHDGFSYTTSIISKSLEIFQQPATSFFFNQNGYNFVSFAANAVALIEMVLKDLIAVRGTEYKDLTVVNVLVELYVTLQAVPVHAEAHHLSVIASRIIVDTLLINMDPTAQGETYAKSLWTLTLSDIVKLIVKAPYCFLPGFKLLSELLPLPLPMVVKETLSDEQVEEIQNARQLWSAHIHPLAGPLHDVFATLAGGFYPPLMQILRRVAIQLSDLGAPSALIVARGILDPLLAILTSSEGGWQTPVPVHACRLLNFLTSLTPHAAIKAAVLSLITSGPNSKADDKLLTLADGFAHILKTPAIGQGGFIEKTHVQAQECILLIIQSLVDTDVSLVPVSGDPSRLANALPSRDLLTKIVSSLFLHVSSSEHPTTCLLFALKPLILITDHDVGFYRIKQSLQTHKDAIYQLVLRLNKEMTPENRDAFNGLHATLALLREFVLDAPTPMRMLTMTRNELARVLRWGEDNHPLVEIHDKLKDWSAKNESLSNLCESAADLLKLLGSSNPEAEIPISKDEDPQIPAALSFMEQISSRPIFNVQSEPDPKTLSAAYWLGLVGPEEAEIEDLVPCDLVDLCTNLLPDFDLVAHVQKLCNIKVSEDEKKPGEVKLSGNRIRRPFVTPMRGRGVRSAPASRGDPFRSRPPNTSRPPSLHVDDFVALETCGQQPTGPTGYNKVSVRNVKEVIVGSRVRTRGRGYQVSPYGRRSEGRPPRGRPWGMPDVRGYRSWQTDDFRRIHPFPR